MVASFFSQKREKDAPQGCTVRGVENSCVATPLISFIFREVKNESEFKENVILL